MKIATYNVNRMNCRLDILFRWLEEASPGAIVVNFLLSLNCVVLGGSLACLIAGFIGACVLIAVARMV